MHFCRTYILSEGPFKLKKRLEKRHKHQCLRPDRVGVCSIIILHEWKRISIPLRYIPAAVIDLPLFFPIVLSKH